jgi:hypothetical protein
VRGVCVWEHVCLRREGDTEEASRVLRQGARNAFRLHLTVAATGLVSQPTATRSFNTVLSPLLDIGALFTGGC